MNTPDVRCELLLHIGNKSIDEIKAELANVSFPLLSVSLDVDNEVDCILHDTGYVKSWYVCEVLSLLIKKITPFVDDINAFVISFNAKVFLLVTFYHDDTYPELHFYEDSMCFIHSLNAEIDIDAY